MGLSLAEAAVRGTTFPTIAEQKQSLLAAGDTEGLIALNNSLFGSATMMAKGDDADDDGDDDDDEGDDDDDADDDDDDSDDDDEDEDDKGKRKKQDPRDVRIQELSAEAKKRRVKAREQRERIAELEAENTRLKGKSKGKEKEEDDEDDSESEDLKAEREKNKTLEARLQQQTLRTEFNDILSNPKTKVKFIDPKAAFRLVDLDDVEVDEDGDVEGMEDAIKDLAKSHPYLLVKEKDDDDDDDDDDKPRRRKTGQRTGGTRKKGQPNRDALIKKYGIKR